MHSNMIHLFLRHFVPFQKQNKFSDKKKCKNCAWNEKSNFPNLYIECSF